MSIKSILLTIILFSSTLLAGQTVHLTPDTVADLARTQSVSARVSAYDLQAHERSVQASFAAFFPTVSVSAGATHLAKRPYINGAWSEEGVFPIDSAFQSSLDSGDLGVMRSLQGVLSRPQPISPQNLYSVGLTVSQPIFTGGRSLNAWRMAQYAYDAGVFAHERVMVENVLSAHRLYWGYVGTLRRIEALRETRQWLENLVRDQQKMFEIGLIIELDVLNARMELDNFKLAELTAQNELRTRGEEMLLLLGIPPETGIEVDTGFRQEKDSDFVPPMPDSLENWLLYRDDLQAANRQLEALKCMKKAQLSAYAPVVAAFATLEAANRYSPEESEFGDNSSFGVQLEWPIFDWGKAWHEAQKADLQVKSAELEVAHLRSQARLKVLELSRKVQESRAALDIAADAVEIARRALEIAHKRYEAQAITTSELLKYRNGLTDKQVTFTQARINAILTLEEYRVAPVRKK